MTTQIQVRLLCEHFAGIDLASEAYLLFKDDAELRDAAFNAPPTEIQIGNGCSSLTFPMSDARLSALTAPMAERLMHWHAAGLPADCGEILVGVTPSDGLGQRWLRRAVKPFIDIERREAGSSRVRLTKGSAAAAVLLVIAYALSHFTRDAGKRIEEKLLLEWGGCLHRSFLDVPARIADDARRADPVI